MILYNLSKKGLTIAIILLFIGLIFNPIINARVSNADDLVDLKIDFCGFNGEKQNVQLTQKELNEVDKLFDAVREQLNVTRSTAESERILYDAIVQLKKYDLIGGLSVNQVQNLFKKYLAIQKEIDSSMLGVKENANCIIAGRVTNAYFFGPVLRYIHYFFNPILLIAFTTGFPFFPFRIGTSITLGTYTEWMLEWWTYPSEGWIVTSGTNGTKKWMGKLLGDIECIDLSFVVKKLLYVGVDGFFGLKIYNPVTGKTSFLGYARKVKIESGWIDEIKHQLLFANVVLSSNFRLFRLRHLWDIAIDTETYELRHPIIFLRALWLMTTLYFWIIFWNNFSNKMDWNWKDIFNMLYI